MYDSVREDGLSWASATRVRLDVVLHSGPEKPGNFATIDEVAIAFTLALTPTSTPATPLAPAKTVTEQSMLTTTWKTLSLTTPTKPAGTDDQKNNSVAKADDSDPWDDLPIP